MAGIFTHQVPVIAGSLVSVHGDIAQEQRAEVVENFHDLDTLLFACSAGLENGSDLELTGKVFDVA
jgi:hypothetical protein